MHMLFFRKYSRLVLEARPFAHFFYVNHFLRASFSLCSLLLRLLFIEQFTVDVALHEFETALVKLLEEREHCA